MQVSKQRETSAMPPKQQKTRADAAEQEQAVHDHAPRPNTAAQKLKTAGRHEAAKSESATKRAPQTGLKKSNAGPTKQQLA